MPNQTINPNELSKEVGIHPLTLASRIRSGWTYEAAISTPAGYHGEVEKKCYDCGKVTLMPTHKKRCPECQAARKSARQQTKKCIECGATYETGCYAKVRCDPCQKAYAQLRDTQKRREAQRKRRIDALLDRGKDSAEAVAILASRAGMTYGKYVVMMESNGGTHDGKQKRSKGGAAQAEHRHGKAVSASDTGVG